jgi:two-component system OmpR family response regulator
LPPLTGQSPIRLLVIEDYRPLAEVTAEFIRWAGLEVQVAESGREALEAVAVFVPDIVLCDLHLPDISGEGIAKALRANPHTQEVLFAIHTAMDAASMQALEREISADLVDLFVSKPLTPERLDRLLEEFASLRRSGSRQSGTPGWYPSFRTI